MLFLILIVSHACAFGAGVYLHKWAAAKAAEVEAALEKARADLKSQL